MADPEVISDQRRYAEVGRAYRSIEPAHQLAQEWRRATDDAAGARELIAEDGDDPELRDLLRTSEERLAELEEEIRLAMVEPDPNDDKDVIVEIRPGAGGERRGCSRPTSTACSTAMPTAAASRPSRSRRQRPLHVRREGPGRVQRLQVRGRHPPRAARARDGVAGPHPHLHRDGRRAARG